MVTFSLLNVQGKTTPFELVGRFLKTNGVPALKFLNSFHPNYVIPLVLCWEASNTFSAIIFSVA
jgi:hypothetical protein